MMPMPESAASVILQVLRILRQFSHSVHLRLHTNNSALEVASDSAVQDVDGVHTGFLLQHIAGIAIIFLEQFSAAIFASKAKT